MSHPQALRCLTPVKRVEELFFQLFFSSYRTYLCGGADEPLYRPINGSSDAVIYYREDFLSSALHEVAHWCIAGSARRRKVDFGYWYCPDGRNAQQQREFESVEVKPQALESLFSLASGVQFNISSDNLLGSAQENEAFYLAVAQQQRRYCCDGLPPRAALFYLGLSKMFSGPAYSSLQCEEAG